MSVDGQLVGVEIKKLGDALNCMFTGRLADFQLPGMATTYDVRYLLIEGVWRPDPASGVLQYWREFDSSKEVKCGKWCDATSGRKRVMFGSFEAWLSTLSVMGGVSVRSAPEPQATASLLLSLYNWWQREDHKSFKVFQHPNGDVASLTRPKMLRRMLSLLPHVEWIRSGILMGRVRAVQFIHKSGRVMRAKDWYIEREIAAKSANDIEEACKGEEHGAT